MSDLDAQIDRIIEGSGAEFGVCIRHVESAAEFVRNGEELYPLASVVKIPIMIEALAQVDEGAASLDERIPLRKEDKVLPSGVLVELDPGLQPTLHDLLMLMIIISDNTATDMVLRRIGLERVEPRMHSAGCNRISVKLNIRGLFDAAFESPDTDLIPAEASAIIAEQARDWSCLSNQRSMENNVASPLDMARLLEALLHGKLLSPDSSAVAFDILLRQQLNARIPRFLPDTVKVAHKTGTFMQARDDAGIIYLPDGTHLIVVTFAYLRQEILQADPLEMMPYLDRVDAAMGHLARAAYDAFSSPE